jgi:hypothetical protein
MSRLPEFITFTGADDETSIEGMVELAAQHPIEWGILFSAKRQGGEPRYPGTPSRFARRGLRLAAHLCGEHSRNALDTPPSMAMPPDLALSFERVQVNHPAPDTRAALAFHAWVGRPVILQARTEREFCDPDIQRLFDRSGGRGVAPETWPRYPGRMVGYAGGIGPENVTDVIRAIDASGPYWIDMESGVRTDDRFDLAKCRRVCEAVYSR